MGAKRLHFYASRHHSGGILYLYAFFTSIRTIDEDNIQQKTHKI